MEGRLSRFIAKGLVISAIGAYSLSHPHISLAQPEALMPQVIVASADLAKAGAASGESDKVKLKRFHSPHFGYEVDYPNSWITTTRTFPNYSPREYFIDPQALNSPFLAITSFPVQEFSNLRTVRDFTQYLSFPVPMERSQTTVGRYEAVAFSAQLSLPEEFSSPRGEYDVTEIFFVTKEQVWNIVIRTDPQITATYIPRFASLLVSFTIAH